MSDGNAKASEFLMPPSAELQDLGTVQIQSRGVIRLLTRHVQKAVRLKDGDYLKVMVDADGRIILEPVVMIPKSESYLFTKEWQSQLATSQADIEAGRTKDLEDLTNHLRGQNED